MATPIFLQVSNRPPCVEQSELCAVGIGTRQPAKLYFSAHRQARNMGGRLYIGEQLRATSRCEAPKENRVDALMRLADFRPPPGLLPPLSLILEADCGKATTAGRAGCAGRATSPSPSSSDTATPESTSDLEGASSLDSESSDSEASAEYGHEARRQQGPPGFFCAARTGPVRPPPGVFF